MRLGRGRDVWYLLLPELLAKIIEIFIKVYNIFNKVVFAGLHYYRDLTITINTGTYQAIIK